MNAAFNSISSTNKEIEKIEAVQRNNNASFQYENVLNSLLQSQNQLRNQLLQILNEKEQRKQ